MNTFSPFGMPQMDPSKMDPKLLMELSTLVQQLPREQLNKMQTLMHNTMAGIDVRKEMEEFEKNLPPGFREKLAAVMLKQAGNEAVSSIHGTEESIPSSSYSTSGGIQPTSQEAMNVRNARLTILRGVAEGQISPEDAEGLLFLE